MQYRLLSESPSRAVPECVMGWHPRNYSLLFVLGLPKEHKEFRKSQTDYGFKMRFRAVLPMLPLEFVGETSRGTKPEGDFAFAKIMSRAGKIAGVPSEIRDIDGMSGGPVFGIRNVRGAARLEWVGIQSGWFPDDDIVSITCAASFLRRNRPRRSRSA
jgi:hypothetical protein